VKLFNFLKRKEKYKQQPLEQWELRMPSIIPQEQVMELSGDEIYNRVRLAKVSYNCESAADDYFAIIAPVCPVREDVAHSLLRIAMRMIFYLGVTSNKYMFLNIEAINSNRPTFLEWVSANNKIVETIVKELTICCIFYDLKFDIEKNVVILDHKRTEEMKNVFHEMQDREIYKEFQSFEEFKAFFYSLFAEHQISQDELDRLILEEDYKEKYFDMMLIKNKHWDVIPQSGRRKWGELLTAELGEKHPLYRKAATPIARCYGQDDVLYKIYDGTYAIVHLTYSLKNQDGWPRFITFKSLEDAITHIKAAES